MNTIPETFRAEEKTLWHITVNLTYEGSENDSCRDGVNRVFSALVPLIENGSGIKEFNIVSLPEKEKHQ